MKSLKDIEKLIRKHKINPEPELQSNILEEAVKIHNDRQQQPTSKTQFDVWRIIISSRITKYTAAAIIILAIIFGIKNRDSHGPDTNPGNKVFQASLFVELRQIRQMAAASDVGGLLKMVAAGQLESKLVAANALNKMVDMPALNTLTMHAAGEMVIDIHQNNLRLYSKESKQWLEVNQGVFVVHSNHSIRSAQQVRITHDDSVDPDAWSQRQEDFKHVRAEKMALEEMLHPQEGVEQIDTDELKEQLSKLNELMDSLEQAVYATIDERGRILLYSPLYQRKASAQLYNGNVRVESHGHIVEDDSITLLHRLAPVRTEGPPLPTKDWRSRFDQVYSLEKEEVLRWVRTPFIPERQIYATQELQYYQTANNNPPPPDHMFFRWGRKLYNVTLAMEGCNLALVLHSLGLKRYEYDDGAGNLCQLDLHGDWIERENAPMEVKLRTLENILQHELGRTIKFDKRKVNRDVIIVRGQYERIPLEDVKNPNKIYVYTDLCEDFPGPEPDDGGGSGTVVELIEKIGSHFNRPVVFETENLTDITVSYVTSLSYSLATANAKTEEDKQKILDSVLQNLSRQSSLQLDYGQHDIDVWFITEEK